MTAQCGRAAFTEEERGPEFLFETPEKIPSGEREPPRQADAYHGNDSS